MNDRLEQGALLQDGRYIVAHHLRCGGQANVYRAHETRLERDVVIKETLGDADWMLGAVEREGKMLARLSHKGLPPVYDYFIENARGYLVMKFIEGADLDTLLSARSEPFSVEQVLCWAEQLLDIVEYLHSQSTSIIHRDINLRNIKIDSNGQIVLLDFGIAKYMSSKTAVLGGSPHYASPEQLKDEGTGPSSDIYSLAATLYHLVTYVQPPDALTREAAALKHNPDPLRPAHECNADVPISLSQALMRAMSLDPADRPQDTVILRQSLREAVIAEPATTETNTLAGKRRTMGRREAGNPPRQDRSRIMISLEAPAAQANRARTAPQFADASAPRLNVFQSVSNEPEYPTSYARRAPSELIERIVRLRNYEWYVLTGMGITGTVGFLVSWLLLHDWMSQSVDRMLPPDLLTKATVFYLAIAYAAVLALFITAFRRSRIHSLSSWAAFFGLSIGCAASLLLMIFPVITK